MNKDYALLMMFLLLGLLISIMVIANGGSL